MKGLLGNFAAALILLEDLDLVSAFVMAQQGDYRLELAKMMEKLADSPVPSKPD